VILAAITASATARGRKVLILVHRRELIHQASSKLTAAGVMHGIIAAGVQRADAPVQVASVQTLVRRLATISWKPCLIIIDEATQLTADQIVQLAGRLRTTKEKAARGARPMTRRRSSFGSFSPPSPVRG
jgi:superfamily II DNA or RNA helicase